MSPQEKLAAAIWAMMGEDDCPVEEQERIAISCEWQRVSEQVRQHFADSDDWKRYDHTDYEALAAYYDEIAIEQGGGI